MSGWYWEAWRRLAAAVIGGVLFVSAAAAGAVNITEDMPFVEITVKGKTYRIERIQDNENRLTNSYAKTSRPCPPFCIHPMEVAAGVTTVGELELIRFLKDEVEPGKGVLVDARISEFFKKGTIPGAVNIPFTLLSESENAYLHRILSILGASKNGDRWDFSEARRLLFFCNGPWCDQSSRAIRGLLAVGFPADRMLYYRGGMQNWQALGLTVIEP